MSLWIAFPGSIAALAAGFGLTVGPMLGVDGPHGRVAIGAAAIVGLTIVNAFGLRPGKWTQNALSGVKLVALAVLLGLGALVAPGSAVRAYRRLLGPPATRRGARPKPSSPSSSRTAAGTPPRTSPARCATREGRPLCAALGPIGTSLCLALYLLINVVYLRAMPVEALARSASGPWPRLARRPSSAAGFFVAALLSPLIAVCVLSSMQASVLVGPRIYQAMALDGLLLQLAARVHRKTQTPLLSLLVQSAVALVQLFSGSFDQLLNFSTVAILALRRTRSPSSASLTCLRVRRPDAPRPFRVPLVAPLLFIGVNVWVLWSVLVGGAGEARVGLAIVASGVPAYAAFRLLRRTPETAP